jgi:hypothetical protein
MKKQVVFPSYPSQSFRIPGKIRAEFDAVETWLQNEAARHGLSISQIVEIALEFAFEQAQAGRITFPEFSRCRRNPVIVTWVAIPESERSGPPPTFPKPTPRNERPKPPPTRTVSYRITSDTAQMVRRMADDYFAIGEMLLILLTHSMTAIQEGCAQLNINFSIAIEPITNTPAINGSEE